MKRWALGAIVLSVLILGAVVVGVAHAAAGDDTARLVADSMLDNILGGMSEKSYAKFSRDFDEKMRLAIPAEKFEDVNMKIAATAGKYQSREFVGIIHKPSSNTLVVLWRGNFAANRDEVLIKLSLTGLGGKYSVSGLWFE